MLAIFMIEGGKPLEMVKAYIADTIRIRAENKALAAELGVEEIYTDRRTGVLTGVSFSGQIHPDFCKPKKRNGASYPKKGSEWEKRLKALKGTHDAAQWIAGQLHIPLSASYRTIHGGVGWRCIGNPLNECGFLWLTTDGPYAMWTPDVPSIIADWSNRGETVREPVASFTFNIDGCRRILREEWDLLVAQRNLEKKRAAAAD